MILFKSDWALYPDAIVDYNTTNRSAVLLAQKLKQMGVENHTFFLALHDQSLQGVDPYSPDLTIDQMVAIGVECKINPWYFFREIARAPANAGNVPSMVEFNRANISLWWSFFNHVTYTLVQPRQTGKSFCTDLLMTILLNFLCSNTQINLMTKDDKLRGANVKRLKDIYEELPKYLNFKGPTDVNNTEEITINRFKNTYKTHVPQMAEKRAYNMGRGLTTAIMHIDEAPFQANIEAAMGTALGAMGAAIEQAQKNGEPYGLILTTTAGKKDDRDGKYIYSYASESARWSERFYDAKTPKELKSMVCKANVDGNFRIYGIFSYKQLGKDDEWMRSQLDRVASKRPEDVNRDFFNVWTSGTQHAPLPVDVLEKLAASIVDHDYHEISGIGGYLLRWYIPEAQIENYMRSKRMVVGIDTSDAVGRDGISFVGTDIETGNTVCVGEFNETNLITFAQWLVEFLVKYDNCTFVIERRSSAVTIIDYLLMFLPQKGIDPYKALFNWVINDPFEHKERHAETQVSVNRRPADTYVRAKKYFGFATSGGGETSRTELYSKTLQTAAKRCADKVKDRALTEQITGLVTRNGRIDHDIGGHDDLVIGWLLCHWFLTMAKNLHHYGIDARSVLVASRPPQDLTPSQFYFEKEQQGFRERITQLFTLMTQETDPHIVEMYERELRHLDSRLVLKDDEKFSIDAMLAAATEERKKSRAVAQGYGYSGRSYYEQMGYHASPAGRGIDGLSGGAMGW